MPTITVPLGNRTYPIYIESGLLNQIGPLLQEHVKPTTVAIVTDDNVAPLYLKQVVQSCLDAGLKTCSITLPHGEETKSLSKLSDLYSFLCMKHITRTDAIVALGGGVIGDLTGLAAATFLRGVPFVQIPTTLLAQVDSSVGGKVAVDLPQGKNLVGAFYQPAFVLVDPTTLHTLTDAYWRDGLGEVVKYGCIGDAELFALLEEDAPQGREGLMLRIDDILSHCIRAKAHVVEQDERDTGLRMTLNFGHTVAHAVETCQQYQGLRHGEAVAVGMRVITRLTEQKGLTAPGTAARLDALLAALALPMELPDIPEENLLSAMSLDKKNAGKKLRVLYIPRIGECVIYPTDVAFFHGLCRK